MFPRIKSPLLCSFILSALLSNYIGKYRGLPFCTVARLRGVLRIPPDAGAYRDIRANTERTSILKGLDHYEREGLGHHRKGIDSRPAMRASGARRAAEMPVTVGNPAGPGGALSLTSG